MSGLNGGQAAASPAAIEAATKIIALLGPPPILVTEGFDEFIFQRDYLLSFFGLTEPIAVLAVERYGRRIWEIARYDRIKPAIVRLATKDALRAILEVCLPDGMDGLMRDELVEGWSGNQDLRNRILARLQVHRIDEETIAAKAVALRFDELAELAAMRDKAEKHARELLEDIAFYQRVS